MRSLKFILLFVMLIAVTAIQAKNFTFYALSNHADNSEPIYLCSLESKTGAITVLNQFSGVLKGNYFALSKDKKSLLIPSLSPNKKAGGLVQFDIAKDGSLSKKQDRFKEGGMPCYVSFTKDNDFAMSADYGDDEISLYKFDKGQLTAEVDNLILDKKARGHYIMQDPSGNNVHAVFLGLDQVRNYRIQNGKFVKNAEQAFFSLPKGQGPRHLVFHDKKPFVYVLNEVGSSVTACSYNKKSGTIEELQQISMLPSDFTAFSKAAAIRIHPNGKFLYASNRGHNSIAVFRIEKDGRLERVQLQGEGINWPRDFILSPDGKTMMVGNEHGDSVVSFKVDPKTGLLTPTGKNISIPRPLAFVFLD